MGWQTLCQKVIIEMFSLTMTLSNDDDSYASHVDQWIELATRNHNIKVLALDFTIKGESKRIKKYSLPDATNVAVSLTSLILRNCELRRPLFCYFLKDLSLTSIKVKILSHIDQVFLGCVIYKPWVILISQGVF